MEEWGNKRANEYYEANLPAHVIRPKEGDAVRVVERFIRDKYEHKRYMGKIPPKNSEASAPAQETPRKVAPTATPAATRTPAAAAAPKPSPAPAPAPAPSLLDFDEPVVSPAPVATPQAAPVFDPFAAPAPVQVAHDFGAFTSAPTHAPPPAPHNVSFFPCKFEYGLVGFYSLVVFVSVE
jgi:stromal membrane-associated protein